MDGLADVGSDVEELIEKSEQNKEEIGTIDKKLFAIENKTSLIEYNAGLLWPRRFKNSAQKEEARV